MDARGAAIAVSLSGAGGAAPVSFDGEVAALREAVRQLPQRQRDALYLRHYLGFEYTAIAETLGVELGTVSATLHAARASLAELLQEVAQ
jgi:RNA polymerase sigma factor (sigma-70 family)